MNKHVVDKDTVSISQWNEVEPMNKEMVIEVDKLRVEIKDSLSQWRSAERHFQYACGHDEVELAIYSLMAAEQKYRMLLNKARKIDIDWSKVKGYVI
ncbi:hypothetical protein [Paenibacillus endoradicis]|uniref:hypothetical protein n=1 Tax=Paenibacillus endoradicis TaxID=2972487 RepID=UPI002159AF33|nr:hypothetical protein [Paenibacillus endoradicis]MCR8658921.1 hypothetical protein [Paenibacillus endoradicis]